MLREIKKTNIIDYKTRQQQFLEWLQEVIEVNFKDSKQIENAILVWAEKDEKGKIKTMHARFNTLDISDVEYFRDCLNDFVQERKFDEFLRDHIGDYLEYIE